MSGGNSNSAATLAGMQELQARGELGGTPNLLRTQHEAPLAERRHVDMDTGGS